MKGPGQSSHISRWPGPFTSCPGQAIPVLYSVYIPSPGPPLLKPGYYLYVITHNTQMFNNNRRKQRTVRLNESEMVSFITETAMRVVREMKLREMGLNNSTYSVQVNGETEKRNFRTPEEAIRYAEFSYRKNMEWCRMLGGCPGEDTFVEVVDDTTGETVWSK